MTKVKTAKLPKGSLMFSAFTEGGANRMAKCYQKAGWKILSTPTLNESTTLWEWNMINQKGNKQ